MDLTNPAFSSVGVRSGRCGCCCTGASGLVNNINEYSVAYPADSCVYNCLQGNSDNFQVNRNTAIVRGGGSALPIDWS